MVNEKERRQFHIKMGTYMLACTSLLYNGIWIMEEQSIFLLSLNVFMIVGVAAMWHDDTVFKRKLFFIYFMFYWMCNIYTTGLYIVQHSASFLALVEKICHSHKSYEVNEISRFLHTVNFGEPPFKEFITDCF